MADSNIIARYVNELAVAKHNAIVAEDKLEATEAELKKVQEELDELKSSSSSEKATDEKPKK